MAKSKGFRNKITSNIFYISLLLYNFKKYIYNYQLSLGTSIIYQILK